MKNYKKVLFIVLGSLIMQSCLGDKKKANISEINDTSFINENFTGNLINYSENMSACENLSASIIAEMYGVSEDKVIFEDISKSDRRVPGSAPSCLFFIKDGDNDFLWLRGSINVQREIKKDETAYEVAKAAGNGEDWEEAWAIQKSISKSSEWIKNIGMAAVWNESKRELKIKLEGYVLYVYPPKNKLNKAETAKNRDYKQVTIEMARASGYIK